MHRSHLWWGKGGLCPGAGLAHWNSDQHIWTFPKSLTKTVNGPAYRGPQWGGQLKFGHLEGQNDHLQFRGAEYQLIGWDELTDFLEAPYRFLFTRLRGVKGLDVPIRMRAASNPGGPGHDWVYRRMVLGADGNPKRRFIPAKVFDNPGLNVEEYITSLDETDPITRMQLLEGLWEIKAHGGRFNREDVDIVQLEDVPYQALQDRIRFWDMAATDPRKTKGRKDPDYTVGALVGQHEGQYYIFDIARDRLDPDAVPTMLGAAGYNDGKQVPIYIEQEGGSEGKIAINFFQTVTLKGYEVEGHHPTASKEIRAGPTRSAWKSHHVHIVNMGEGRNYRDEPKNGWIEPFLDEVEAFGATDESGRQLWQHDDQVDALTGAHAMLVERGPRFLSGISLPGGLTEDAWHGGLEGLKGAQLAL